MSPELLIALHKRGVAFDRGIGARSPAEQDSRCAVQRIRPGCRQFTADALRARAQARPSAWQRLRAWLIGPRTP